MNIKLHYSKNLKKMVPFTEKSVAIMDKEVLWNNELQMIDIFDPKLIAKKQDIYYGIHKFFGSKNKIQRFPFDYMIENKNLCKRQNFTAINFLLTSPGEETFRHHIRSRWGNDYWMPRTGIKVVHLLAASNNPEVNKAVFLENKIYRDIIQVNFIDSYDNLTFKSLSLLHWTKYNCKNVDWVIKSDTDVLVNIFLMPK